MRCLEAAALIRDHLDRELEADHAADLERHLAACADCARRLQAERDLKQVVRAHARLDPAPAGLDARIARTLREQAPVATGAGIRRWLPAAALVLLALGLGLARRAGLWDGGPADPPPGQMLADLVGGHLCCLSHGPADPEQQIVTGDRAAAGRWLTERLGFDPALPCFRGGDMQLLGARLCQVAGRRAAVVGYERGAKRWSLFVLEGAGLPLPEMPPSGERRFPCVADSYGGYRALCWRRAGLLYALVADEEPAPMVELVAQCYEP